MKNAAQDKGLGAYGTVGLEIVLSILLGLWLGTWLDGRFGTAPWLAVLWFGFGCAAAGKAVHRSWKQMQAAAAREEAEEGNPAQELPDEKALKWKREDERRAREMSEPSGLGDETAPPEVENDGPGATDQAEKRDG
jgi:ATP synthase protein I